MKQHNDRHPVLDALGRLDEEAIHTCLQEDVSPRMTVSRATLCRRVAVAAACLALTAAVGLTALLPLMRPSTPGVEGTEAPVTDDTPISTDTPATDAPPSDTATGTDTGGSSGGSSGVNMAVSSVNDVSSALNSPIVAPDNGSLSGFTFMPGIST